MHNKNSLSSSEISRLLEVMERLRDTEDGCPWDRTQTNETIAPYTIEEAYEVAHAIAVEDTDALQEELGDLLFQIVFYAQMASEAGQFSFADIVHGVTNKMVRRHPHVFAGATIGSVDSQTVAWERDKKKEREARAHARGDAPSILDGIPTNLPALTRAIKLQKRAAEVGFDWPSAAGAISKLREEIVELTIEIVADNDPAAISEEFGDVLFSWVNIARLRGIDPESSLRTTNDKFESRLRAIESTLAADGRKLEDASLNELETHWQQVKQCEKAK